ncbi:transcription elongation factor GreA [Phototrophicus methaneseepsis]|uniref:Transcription elongation factor GreA n=1 Tax=Phototrophicus methaneseepsis TaxID=2710758 RepID=A0A7S8IDI8_9CHLR|nr:transcription elongation factor GreA [Phototrophicus methaneseepsis]QPC80848.1 transcription elongation factor GreA [Phototrophicus methaneseepsis]
MQEEVTYVTAEGMEELRRELTQLREVKRPELAQRLKEAVSMGDLKENADYHDTREQMALLDGRINHIEAILRNAVIIENDGPSDEVRIGSKVTIREEGEEDDEVYSIVGAAEANPREGRISQKSPIGAALIGRRKGDKVRVETPNGQVVFKIRKIE